MSSGFGFVPSYVKESGEVDRLDIDWLEESNKLLGNHKIFGYATFKNERSGRTFYQCECGKVFNTKNDLGYHLQNHHSIEPKYIVTEEQWIDIMNPSRRDM